MLLWIKRSHVKTACEPEKATNDARWVRFGLLPETGSVVRASHERCLSPTSADYTRGQATFAPLRAGAGTQVPSLLGLSDCTRRLPVAPLSRRAGSRYEYRSLERFAQELRGQS